MKKLANYNNTHKSKFKFEVMGNEVGNGMGKCRRGWRMRV